MRDEVRGGKKQVYISIIELHRVDDVEEEEREK